MINSDFKLDYSTKTISIKPGCTTGATIAELYAYVEKFCLENELDQEEIYEIMQGHLTMKEVIEIPYERLLPILKDLAPEKFI
jgi:hypothetical protein